ncbi:MAG: polyprenyl synthetase family protein [Rhodothermales bacterium]|nr:polyprenyl synthetase family protein [Rhodothermales bacterium]MBO6781441.1 polyprenyl synthetase family protein [Rhodothermales bacterium]
MDLSAHRDRIEAALARAVGASQPPALYEPAEYVMAGQGKRLRPLLVLLAAETHGLTGDEALPGAVAVEVFHNFTLVHDDIMDNADSRRGRDTVHIRWDEPTAILVGDLLMGIAYEHIARLPHVPKALTCFNAMVRRLCEGQTLDMDFETRRDVTLDDYLEMINGKTGALLACCLELGAIAAGADAESRARMAETGRDIGRAFQIQDDLLDLTADSAKWGKQVGGDVMEGKRTWLLIQALERASTPEDRALLERVLDGGVDSEEVPEVRALMDRLGVLKDTRDAVIFHSDAAIGRLREVSESPAREALIGLVRSMQARLH